MLQQFIADWFSGLLSYFGLFDRPHKLAFLGLDNAGKSTLLQVLAEDRVSALPPTLNPSSCLHAVTARPHSVERCCCGCCLW